jgi:hypothetical protein
VIIKLSKASSSILDQVADFVLKSRAYLSETFPQCRNKDEVANALRNSGEQWTVLVTDRPLALFSIAQADTHALIEHLCPENMNALDSIFTALQEDLKKRRLDRLIINVPIEQADAFIKTGLEKKSTLLGLSGRVVETKLMPILPVTNPRHEDIPALGKLMYDSYAKSVGVEIPNVAVGENLVRNTIDGLHGTFLQDASFVSNASGKLVSASLITSGGSDFALSFICSLTHFIERAGWQQRRLRWI